jgi:alpha-aminoadipic semialdehyde synthase
MNGGDLMSNVQNLDFLPGFALEGFPNRDSLIYRDHYGLHNANTVLRGTLRFKGFSDTILGLQLLGLIDPNPQPILHPNGPDITWVSAFNFSHYMHIYFKNIYDCKY